MAVQPLQNALADEVPIASAQSDDHVTGLELIQQNCHGTIQCIHIPSIGVIHTIHDIRSRDPEGVFLAGGVDAGDHHVSSIVEGCGKPSQEACGATEGMGLEDCPDVAPRVLDGHSRPQL